MASIRVTETRRGLVVTIRGDLVAADLPRLERACGPALEQRQAELELVVKSGTVADSAARAYVARLQARGAVIRE